MHAAEIVWSAEKEEALFAIPYFVSVSELAPPQAGAPDWL